MAVVLSETGELQVDARDGFWLRPEDTERSTGFAVKPEGLCQGELCVPLPPAMERAGRIDVAAFWRHLGRPVAHEPATDTWVLGAGAEERNTALAGATAPDFTLPDLAGQPHRLAELRGKKVLLSTWASW